MFVHVPTRPRGLPPSRDPAQITKELGTRAGIIVLIKLDINEWPLDMILPSGDDKVRQFLRGLPIGRVTPGESETELTHPK
jgi:hypothetical protein